MARISQYEQDGTLNKQDKVLGTDSDTGATKNYTIDSILSFVNTENLVEIFDGAAYTFQSYVDPTDDPEGVINLNAGGATATAFSAINRIYVSVKDGRGQSLVEYLENAQNDFIKISKTDNLNQFGIYEVDNIVTYGDGTYRRLDVTPRGTNGTITVGEKYFVANYSALYDQDFSDDSVTEFQDVHTAGSGHIITTEERQQLQGLNANALLHADVVNNLTSTAVDLPLSAEQGRVLKGLINTINTLLTVDDPLLDTLQEVVDYIEVNRSTLGSLGISSIAGLQNALNAKQNTESGKGLSANDFTNDLLQKLEGIAAGAQINVKPNWSAAAGTDAEILNKPSDLTNLGIHDVNELRDVTSAGSGAIITGPERTKLTSIDVDATTRVVTDGTDSITVPPQNAEQNVQANWGEQDTNSDAFIQNKPSIVSSARTITVQGTTDEIEVTPNTAQDLTADRTVTIGLPDDVTISNDLTVTDALSVGESIEITETLSATPTFDNGIYFSTDDNHDTLHFRYHGHDLSIDYLTEIVPTGILNGGELTKANNTQFTIAAGDGVINDLNKTAGSDPHPEIKKVEWSTQTITVSNLDSGSTQEKNSWIYVDDTGTVQQKTGTFTEADYRTSIPIGAAIHSSGIIRLIKTFPRTAYNNMSQLNEFAAMFGPMKKSGHVLSANGSNLSLDRSAGVAFAFGRNYVTDPENPSTVSDGSKTQCLIHRYYRDGSGEYTRDTNAGAGYTTIDPTKYDDNSGTLATHSSFMFTIQRFYYFPGTPDLLIQYYGRDTYMTMESAERNLPTDPHGEAENTAGQAIYLGAIIVQQNCTDLTNTADAKFFASGAFRSLVAAPVGAVAAAALSDLTDANVTSPTNGQVLKYNSSTQQFENQAEGGSIDGTGVANKLAIWSDSDTLTNDVNLAWDSNNDRLAIGTGVASNTLTVNGGSDDLVASFQSTDGIARIEFRDQNTPQGTSPRIGAAGNDTTFTRGNTESMRIKSDGKVGIGTTNPAASLDIDATDAIIVPKGTDADRSAITAESGMFRFNTTSNEFEGYDGTEWGAIGGAGGGSGEIVKKTFNGGVSTYQLDDTIADIDNVQVFVDGVYQYPSNYTVSGSTVTFVAGSTPGSGTNNVHIAHNVTVPTLTEGAAMSTSTNLVGDGNTTSFALGGSPRSSEHMMVFLNGVYQEKTTYTLSGSNINFNDAPLSGYTIEVKYITGTLDLTDVGQMTLDELTGNGGTTYALSATPQSENYTNVYIEGVYQEKGTYDVSGSNIVFSSNIPTGYSIEVSTMGTVAASSITPTTFETDTFTANGTDNNFTLVNGSPSSKALTMVFIQGVYQAKSKYNLVSGQIQFTGGTPAEDDVIEVISISAVNTANSPVTSVNGQTGVVSIDAKHDVSVISANTTAVANTVYVFTASLTLTLPASPTLGDSIKISNLSDVATCVLGANGNKIMDDAADLTLDTASASFELIWSGTAKGWVIIGQ